MTEQGLTYKELAEMCGMPALSLERMSNGRQMIDVAQLGTICEALGVAPSLIVRRAEGLLGRSVAS